MTLRSYLPPFAFGLLVAGISDVEMIPELIVILALPCMFI
jgi:hypothetical protein